MGEVHPGQVPFLTQGFYLGQSQFFFNVYPTFYTRAEIRYNGGSWQLVEDGIGYQTPLLTPPFTSPGEYTMEFKWYTQVGETKTLPFTVLVVPSRDRRYTDGQGNQMSVWQGGTSYLDRPILVSEGFDPINQSNEAYYYGLAQAFFDNARALDADIIIMNYDEGGQDIRLSAQTISGATDYVSSIQTGSQDIILTGISMGGVICRYALAKAEDEGTPLDVSHFLSIDAPQIDALIDSDLQDELKSQDGGDPDPSLSSLAAKQMLRYNAYDESGAIHNSFYSELNSLNGDGYPDETINIGVAFSAPGVENPNSGKWLEISPNIPFGIGTKEYFINPGDAWKEPGSFLPEGATSTWGFASIFGLGAIGWSAL